MHPLLDRYRQHLEVLGGVAMGIAAASVALLADHAVELSLGIPPSNALALLAATFSALVTAGAFAFWMLPLAAQLAASAVPPPVVAGHLHGGFQRRVVTATLGALAYTAVALAALPASPDTSPPTITTVVGASLGVAAIAALLVAMDHAVRSTRPSVLVSQAAHAVIDQIRGRGQSDEVQDTRRDAAHPGSTVSVPAPATGWLHAVEEDALLRNVPEGTTISLEVGLGAFLVEGWTTVAKIRGEDLPDDIGRHLRAHFTVEDERAAEQALVGMLTRFTDIAVHAGSGGSGAPSIVYESIWYLGAILHELVRHEPGRTVRRNRDGGRVLEWSSEPDAASLAHLAADRIRQVTASEPAMALELVRVLVDASTAAERAGRDQLVDVLQRQADLAVEQCRHADPLPADLDRVVAARAREDHVDRAAERDEEYATDQSEPASS